MVQLKPGQQSPTMQKTDEPEGRQSQNPLVQELLQHSALDVQGLPGNLQHVPMFGDDVENKHRPEQQSPFWAQPAPAPVHWQIPLPQFPEQQFAPAWQIAPFALQLAHTPAVHTPLQQSEPDWQLPPGSVHAQLPPLHTPPQQSDVWAQL